MNHFQPVPYKSEGGFSAASVPILLALLCLAGAVLGWLASLISQWFYLIVLFPLGIGFGLVMVGGLGGHLTKMRSRGLAAVLGLAGSSVAVLTMHYFDYQRFLSQRESLLSAELPPEGQPGTGSKPGVAEPQQFLAGAAARRAHTGVRDTLTPEAGEFLRRAKAVNSLSAYMEFAATQGVSIGRIGSSKSNLGYVGTWIYWFFEWAMVAFMTTMGLILFATAPFCSSCNTWKVERPLGTLRGDGAEAAEILATGEIQRLTGLRPAVVGGPLELSASVCPNCKTASSVVIKLVEVTKKSKNEVQRTELGEQLTYPGGALSEFESLFGDKPSEEAGR